MKLTWSRDATNDLIDIRNYVSADDAGAAARLAASILDCIASLERFPQRGRTGRIAGTRELVVVGTCTSSPIASSAPGWSSSESSTAHDTGRQP